MQEIEQNNDVIDRFLIYYSSKQTKAGYGCILKRFFRVIKCNPNDYFKQNRDYEYDIRTLQTISKILPQRLSTLILV